MNCLDHGRLFSYAHRLLEERDAAQVRTHLAECSRCREAVEKCERLDAVLGEWKPAEPSAWFDARVRRAVEAQEARRAVRGFWSPGWVRGLALASLGVMVIAGMAWLTHRDRSVSTPSTLASQHARQTVPAPAQVVKLNARAVTPPETQEPRQPAPKLQSAGASLSEDEDVRALDDYDLVADFDVLSELSKKGARVAN